MATFVYHLCAPDFRGTTLFPLDDLREVLPEIYERERVKYDRRESVLEYVIPGLGVTWGATVNLSALDPAHLVAARRRLGVPFSTLLTRRVLRIPVNRIAHLPAVRYNSKTHWINSSPGDASVPLAPPEREFLPFDPVTYEEVAEVPELHLEYLRRQLGRGERALGFVFVPHVLVAGPIDVSGLESEELPSA
jgi:hypothetical protein